jgi:uncharacterized RDD family membrane protein YckC
MVHNPHLNLLQGLLVAALAGMAGAPEVARANPGPAGAPRIGLLCGDRVLWVYQHRRTAQGERLTLALRPPGSQTFVGPARFRDLATTIEAAATVGDDLDVFYSNSHRRYALSGARVLESTELPLPGGRSWGLATDRARSALMVLIDKRTALRIEQIRRDRLLADFAGQDEAPELPPAFDPGDSTHFLARYAGGRWEIVAGLPPSLTVGKRNLLGVDAAGGIHLVLVSDSEWTRVAFQNSTWTVPRSTPAANLTPLALIAHRELTGLVGWQKSAVPLSLEVQWSDKDDRTQVTALQLPDWPEPATVEDVAVAVVGDTLAVAAVDDRQVPRISFGALQGEAAFAPWAQVSALRGSPPQGIDAEVQSLVAFVLLGLLLGYVFWRRQSSITRELELPASYRLAGYSRRLIGFCVDFGLTLGPTRQWWWPRLQVWLDSYELVALETGQAPSMSPSFVVGWMMACLTYAVFAAACEAWFGTTPGKALVHCRAVSETGHRMLLRQVLARNILRTVELFPAFMLFPPFILILFTRNRQRLGDLVARTVVVERVRPERNRARRQTSDNSDVRESPPDDEEK